MTDLTQFTKIAALKEQLAKDESKLSELYKSHEIRQHQWIIDQISAFANANSFSLTVASNTGLSTVLNLSSHGLNYSLKVGKQPLIGVWTVIEFTDPNYQNKQKQIDVYFTQKSIDSPIQNTSGMSEQQKLEAKIQDTQNRIVNFKDHELSFGYGRVTVRKPLIHGTFEEVFAFVLNNPEK